MSAAHSLRYAGAGPFFPSCSTARAKLLAREAASPIKSVNCIHGAFAPNAKVRPKVVPQRPSTSLAASKDAVPSPPSAYRLEWAALIKRTFASEVLVCARCGGRCRVIAVIEEVNVVKKVLAHLGLPPVPLPIAPARGPPQPSFAFDVA